MIDSVPATENCGRVVLNSFLIFLPSDALKMCLISNYPCCNNSHGYLASQKIHFLISVGVSSSLPVVEISTTTAPLRIR